MHVLLVEDILWPSYSRVILEADDEPATELLLTTVLKDLQVQEVGAMQKVPFLRDSQANGGKEMGCKLVRGMLKTFDGMPGVEGRLVPTGRSTFGCLDRTAWGVVAYCSSASP